MVIMRATGRAAGGGPDVRRRLRQAAAAGVIVICSALLPAATAPGAAAEPAPKLSLKAPPSPTNDATPTFHASSTYQCEAEPLENCGPVLLHISGVEEPLRGEEPANGNTWPLTVKAPLAQGTYTATAEQTVRLPLLGEERIHSNSVTVTIDTTPPQVGIASPANGSSTTGETQLLAGAAGAASGDLPTVTVNLYTGSSAGPTPMLALSVQRSEAGSWSAPFGGLKPGTYTAQATQEDSAHNLGRSAPVTFTVNAPSSSGPPPAASFTWFPANPLAGQSVALVSSSTDSVSPISGYSWDLAGNGLFKPGGPVLTTSFARPGKHVVRLQVYDARGSTSIATETINVSSAQLALMQPFPIVRIAGNQSSSGVTISLLTVQAPIGSRVSLSCHGRGCNRRFVARNAVASKRNRGARSAVITFRRPERRLGAGAVLEIRVSKPSQIGKFTRFAIHRRKLPTREDACISSTNPRAIACPA